MILGWLGALVVGLSLGLLGLGGSILTIPILVYLIGVKPKLAIAASLAIVGAISLAGAANYASQRLVAWRYVLLFGLPSVVAAYAGAWLSHFVSGVIQLVVFASIMALAAGFMLRPSRRQADEGTVAPHWIWLLAAGFCIGLATGFVGVGGGFMIVPALVILGGLEMHRAVGTSLAIIVLNSASGFYKHFDLVQDAHLQLPWTLIGVFIALGVAGSLAGNVIARRLPRQRLQQVFGWLLLAMCGYVLWRSLPQLF